MIVLDTHVLIWDALAPDRLSPAAREAIDQGNRQDGVIISDISLWEIAMLLERGRVQVAVDSQSFLNLILQANKTIVKAITPQIATLAVRLSPNVNKDPADRLIAATAIVENVPLVTADRNLQTSSQLATVW